MRIHQWVPQREGLTHANQCVVDRLVTVGVVLADHIADDRGRLLVVAVGPQSGIVHRPENPTMDGLEPVAHVGQGPRDDDRHRVVEERLLHLLLDLDRIDGPDRRDRLIGPRLIGT